MIEPAACEAAPRPIPHGTPKGYGYYKCRCAACREAETARQRDYRRRLRAGTVRHRASDCPVRIRGVEYGSIAQAAAKLGVAPPTVSHQLRIYGHAERAGLGCRGPDRPFLASIKPCRILNRDFPSRAAAARYLGVCYTYLCRQLKDGPTAEFCSS